MNKFPPYINSITTTRSIFFPPPFRSIFFHNLKKKIITSPSKQPLSLSPLALYMSTESPKLPKLSLYSYWRSSSAWRVRVVLALKNIPYEYKATPLLQKIQQSEEYTSFNPMQQVPTLKIDDENGQIDFISQSLAIIEYLESLYPENSVYSKAPLQRAYEHELALDIVSGIQPLQNLNILLHIKALTGEEEKKLEWAVKYITQGLVAIETKVKNKPLLNDGKYISIFHCCLIPQLYNARRFKCDMSLFPTLLAIEEWCLKQPAFIAADPDNQPDANQL